MREFESARLRECQRTKRPDGESATVQKVGHCDNATMKKCENANAHAETKIGEPARPTILKNKSKRKREIEERRREEKEVKQL